MDMMQLLSPPKKNAFLKKSSGCKMLELYLVGQIGAPDQYTDWFHKLRSMGEDDIVKIYINSPGGRMDTSIQFLRVMSECPATIITSAEGVVASAATIIFLAGCSQEVTPHSSFLFHNFSSGVIGKGAELESHLDFTKKWAREFLSAAYKDFLTKSEMSKLSKDQDLWMHSDEVVERLNIRAKKRAPKAQKTKKK